MKENYSIYSMILLFAAITVLMSGLPVNAENLPPADTSVGLQTVTDSGGETDYYFYNYSGEKECNVLKTISAGKDFKTYYFGRSGKAVKDTWKTVNGYKG